MKVVSIAGDTGGTSGLVDDYGPDARFHTPYDIGLDPDDPHMLYIADYGNDAIRTLDLDTGYADTLCTLAASPTHLCVSTGHLWVSARGASKHLYDIDRSDGSTVLDITPPGTPAGTLGSIAQDAQDPTFWWVKGPIGEYTTGWYRLTADGTLTLDAQHDGPYAADTGSAAAAGHTWKQREYVAPSGRALFTTGPPVITSARMDQGLTRQLAASPWPPAPGTSRIYGTAGGADLVYFDVTATTFEAYGTVDLDFDAADFRGIATDTATQTLYFSGLNQIWMSDIAGQWHTRWV